LRKKTTLWTNEIADKVISINTFSLKTGECETLANAFD